MGEKNVETGLLILKLEVSKDSMGKSLGDWIGISSRLTLAAS